MKKEQLEFLRKINPKTIKLENMEKILKTIEAIREKYYEELSVQLKKIDDVATHLTNKTLKLQKEEWRELIALIELFCGMSRKEDKDLKNNFNEAFKSTLKKMGMLDIGYEWGDSYLNSEYRQYLLHLELEWSIQAGKNSGIEIKQEELNKLEKFDDLIGLIKRKKNEKIYCATSSTSSTKTRNKKI